MRQRHATLVTLLAAALLAGCATPYGRARTALAEERYEEAASGFEEILTRHPDRLDALIGLGKARYKLGTFDDAITALTRAAARAPKSETAHLYLGLSHLRKGEDGPAEEHLKTLLALGPHPRLAAQTSGVLELRRRPVRSVGGERRRPQETRGTEGERRSVHGEGAREDEDRLSRRRAEHDPRRATLRGVHSQGSDRRAHSCGYSDRPAEQDRLRLHGRRVGAGSHRGLLERAILERVRQVQVRLHLHGGDGVCAHRKILWAGGASPDRQARVRPEIHRVAEIVDAQPVRGGRAGMGRGRGVIRVIVGALLLGGCAQFYWSKPNGTAEQFDRASRECARDAAPTPTAAAHGIVDERIYRACLSALGWRREKQWDPPPPGWFRGIE